MHLNTQSQSQSVSLSLSLWASESLSQSVSLSGNHSLGLAAGCHSKTDAYSRGTQSSSTQTARQTASSIGGPSPSFHSLPLGYCHAVAPAATTSLATALFTALTPPLHPSAGLARDLARRYKQSVKYFTKNQFICIKRQTGNALGTRLENCVCVCQIRKWAMSYRGYTQQYPSYAPLLLNYLFAACTCVCSVQCG